MEHMNYQKIVLIKTISLIFPAFLLAGSVDLSLEKHNGKSSYIVQKPNFGLKSKLDFPFKLETLSISTKKEMESFDLYVKSNFMINSKDTIGKDYDWQNDDLTVFSTSSNQIEKFRDFTVGIDKRFSNKIKLTNKLNYKNLDILWKDTYQEDFVKNKIISLDAEALKYSQKIYQYNLGINYKIELLRNILLEIEPSLIYAYIDAKDSHLLRNFDTKQYSHAFGIGGKIDLSHKINEKFIYGIFYDYQKFEDKNTNMDYFNQSTNVNYQTLPSSYEYKNQTTGIYIKYLF